MRRNKNMLYFQDFDIETFLQDYNISFKGSGTNIGQNWLGLEVCPFCNATNFHLGVNIQSKGWSCFVCGESGAPPKLIQTLLSVSKTEAYTIINKYSEKEITVQLRETGKKVILPSNLYEISGTAKKYLKKRGFTDYHIQKYKLKQTRNFSKLKHNGQESDFSFRIIFPIIMNHQLVSYTGRDYTEQREPRYRHPFLEACIIPPSSSLMGIDTVTDKCIIVEGPTDLIKMGDECVCTCGVKVTKEQIKCLAEKKLKKAVILFDMKAEENAIKLANSLSGVVNEVEIAALNNADDPGDLSASSATQIKHQLLYI